MEETSVGSISWKGSLEGQKDFDVYRDLQKSHRITDIDRIEGNVLWEEKTAVSAVKPEKRIAKHITEKFYKYLEARSLLPLEYHHAGIEFDFLEPHMDAEFRQAIEVELDRLRKLHTDVEIYFGGK